MRLSIVAGTAAPLPPPPPPPDDAGAASPEPLRDLAAALPAPPELAPPDGLLLLPPSRSIAELLLPELCFLVDALTASVEGLRASTAVAVLLPVSRLVARPRPAGCLVAP